MFVVNLIVSDVVEDALNEEKKNSKVSSLKDCNYFIKCKQYFLK
jgi:hypothetical protein